MTQHGGFVCKLLDWQLLAGTATGSTRLKAVCCLLHALQANHGLASSMHWVLRLQFKKVCHASADCQ